MNHPIYSAEIPSRGVSTGPCTEAGKERSSRNSLKTGLYTNYDFVANEDEAKAYAALLSGLQEKLSPEGVLEETFFSEILTSTWRLRRCRSLEGELLRTDKSPEEIAKLQQSIDRARAQAHRLLTKSMSELSKLQTEQAARDQLRSEGLGIGQDVGLVDVHQFIKTLTLWTNNSICAPAPKREAPAAVDSSFCKTDSSFCKPEVTTPRNAPCPCGSGEKYKRCCGKNAPPMLQTAA